MRRKKAKSFAHCYSWHFLIVCFSLSTVRSQWFGRIARVFLGNNSETVLFNETASCQTRTSVHLFSWLVALNWLLFDWIVAKPSSEKIVFSSSSPSNICCKSIIILLRPLGSTTTAIDFRIFPPIFTDSLRKWLSFLSARRSVLFLPCLLVRLESFLFLLAKGRLSQGGWQAAATEYWTAIEQQNLKAKQTDQ